MVSASGMFSSSQAAMPATGRTARASNSARSWEIAWHFAPQEAATPRALDDVPEEGVAAAPLGEVGELRQRHPAGTAARVEERRHIADTALE